MLFMRERSAATAIGAAGLALLVAGCGTTATSKPVTHARSATSTTPSPVGSIPNVEARAALASYSAMWADLATVADSGNYQQSRLGDHMAGQLLLTSSQNLFLDEQHGMITKGAPILLRPAVTAEDLSAKPPEITVSDCVDGSHFLVYYAATGKPIDNDPGGFQSVTVKMTQSGGVWKASSEYVGAVGSCTR